MSSAGLRIGLSVVVGVVLVVLAALPARAAERGAEGAAIIAEVDTGLRAQGVRRPAALAWSLAPGGEPPADTRLVSSGPHRVR